MTSGLVTGLVALLLAFFFVKDGTRFTPWVRTVGAPRGGARHEVLHRVWRTVGE